MTRPFTRSRKERRAEITGGTLTLDIFGGQRVGGRGFEKKRGGKVPISIGKGREEIMGGSQRKRGERLSGLEGKPKKRAWGGICRTEKGEKEKEGGRVRESK